MTVSGDLPGSQDRGTDGWRLAPHVKRRDVSTLVAGTPYRVVKLTADEAEALTILLADGRVAETDPATARKLDRLVRGGLVVPPLPVPVRPADVTVVVPAHATPDSLRRLLATIPDDIPVVVVDDASPEPLRCLRHGRPNLTVVRHPRRRGAAAARNTGAARATTRWLVFADVDIEPTPGWLGALLAVAAESDVVATAPRIVNSPAPGLAGLVETRSSALDMGANPVDVGRESAVTWVPTATLLMDRARFLALGGFDESMKIGEDVDLIWRLLQTGRVRYEPRIRIVHRSRTSLWAVLARRSFYSEGIGLLEARHPGAFRYVDAPARALLPWLLGVFVHPAVGVVAAGLAVAVASRDSPQMPPGLPVRVALDEQLNAATSMNRWLARPMLPLVGLALAVSPAALRRRLGIAIAAGYLDKAVRATVASRRAGAPYPTAVRGAVATVVAKSLVDASQCVGVWRSCVATGTTRVLLPRVRLGASRRHTGPRGDGPPAR